MNKPKVGFICVHNSCRSQMAEALGKLFASEVFESYSAGTELRSQINQDAVKVIKKLYSVDMNKTQKSKLLEDIPKLDIVIKMGCNVICPLVMANYIEDWGIDDPSGSSEENFELVAKIIEEKVKSLSERIKKGDIKF
ncbi:arsenate reductase ArsC [uncultured Clostridium sp.]|uniref:arsenate-mycothiol transferase ArsC n=1 Tax=uncultured Clostridium sp. TaxID=59620 RepID=UPI002634E7B1|nr:arsenate reductase ArsC [uncultured Clostridium sp.]